ncbi:MAG: patatin-like phospholipase family protein [Bacteroidales bacterium]
MQINVFTTRFSLLSSAMYVRITVILMALSVSANLNGQGTGLVLSGGGAKGLAHIGVIEALEENNIQIDYIAGTSMGAIVGALYAMGYTPAEMRDLVLSDDFRRWTTGEIDPKLKFSYKRAENDPSIFTIGLKREEDGTKPRLPSHLVPSVVMDFALMELTCGPNAVSGNNFDSLMVPFRCVAADIYNKRVFVMRGGNLGQAVKASAAYPLYFEPAIIDSVLLFDGGIYNNFPYDVLIEDFRPDFIIGSKVANRSPRPGRDDLMLQLQNMIMQETDYTIPDSLGVVIETNIEGVQLLDFEKADTIIRSGYLSALKSLERILPWVKINEPGVIGARREEFRANMPDTLFKNITIEGVNDRQEEYITNLVSKKESVFDISQLKREYFRLVSEENIEQAFPEARYNADIEAFDLTLKVRLKEAYSLSAGGLISLSTYNQIYLGFNYQSLSDIFNMFSANVYVGEYYSSFSLAHRIAVAQKKRLVIDFNLTGNRWNYFTNETPTLFKNISSSYAVRNERYFKSCISTPVSNNSVLKTGLTFLWLDDAYYQSFRYNEFLEPDKSEYFYAGLSGGFESSTLDRKQYSSRGNSASTILSYFNGFEFYSQGVNDTIGENEIKSDQYGWFTLRIKTENYNRMGERIVVGSYFDITLSNRKAGNNYTSSVINSYKFEPTPFSRQLFARSLRSNSYLGGGLSLIYEQTKDFQFRTGLFLFAPVRELVQDGELVEYGDYFQQVNGIAELAVIYHTRLGPLSMGLNYFTNESKKVYYFVNMGYILFNRKGLE